MRRFLLLMISAAITAAVFVALPIAYDQFRTSRTLDTNTTRIRPPSSPTPNTPRIALIGEWEDVIGTWKQRIQILDDQGQILRELRYPDGRVDRDILVEITPEADEQRRFENPSHYGQTYAIDSRGNLAIFDNDGYVGSAKSTSTTMPTNGETR